MAQAVVFSPQTLKAIVHCLHKMIPDAHIAERASAEEATYRTQYERDAINVLEYILPYVREYVIEAGLISRWLANYPFGGPGATLIRKRRVIMEIVRSVSSYEDQEFGYAMKMILAFVLSSHGMKDELMKYGLVDAANKNYLGCQPCPQSQVEVGNRILEDPVRLDGELATEAGNSLNAPMTDMDWIQHMPNDVTSASDGIAMPAGSRPREESIEERALRRRRREAVVVGRNGQPIQNEDIIQREAGMVDHEGEGDDGSESLMRMREAESRGQGSLWGLLTSLRPSGLAPV